VEKIYELCSQIPRGKVSTYSKLAKLADTSPRAVGQVLKRNPYKDVPCHRVVNSDGSVGGYRGRHFKEKIFRLRKEGVTVKNGRIDLKLHLS
jgi:methylated-DNA-[protein]-cysteine S-methyltransferase